MDFFAQHIIPGEVFVQLLAFLFLLFFLQKAAWGPILDFLEARRAKIKSEFDRIEQIQQEMDRLKAEYASRVEKMEEAARLKVQASLDDSKRIAKEIQEKARLESQAYYEKSKENLALEVEKARIELRREIATLVILATEKVLSEKLDENKQREKITGILESLERKA